MRAGLVAATMAMVLVGTCASAVHGQAPEPPSNLLAKDHPWDGGDKVDLTWSLSPQDAKGVDVYVIYRSMTDEEAKAEDKAAILKAAADAKKAAWKAAKDAAIKQGRSETEARAAALAAGLQAGEAAAKAKREELAAKAGQRSFKFVDNAKAGTSKATVEKLSTEAAYAFRVMAQNAAGEASPFAETTANVSPAKQAFEGNRLWVFIIVFVLCGSIGAFILLARTGMPLKVRKIAGLEAVDEAVGRATEMGRPCLFVPGIQDMNDIQTVAGITVLARVAKTAAEYGAKVEVPTSRSLVMTAARETVQNAFLAAGRPDAYNEDNIYYVTDEQFGYVAYLSGMMVREKPAACFYMGSFFAESLILAETGNSIGAIQIAGTAQPAQLPFFVAACDYTLIGEEFFAASAYLSGEPEQLGSLKGQDVGKFIVAVVLIVGVTLMTIAAITGSKDVGDIVDFLKGTMLT